MSFPFSFWKTDTSWPSGADGPLIILNGEFVILTGGDVKDYSSVYIENGGILYILGGTGRPTIIGCSGDMFFDGAVYAQDAAGTGSFTRTAPDGTVISYILTIQFGGNGGYDGAFSYSSGLENNGNGGGGSSYIANGEDALNNQGGSGASGYDDISGSYDGGLGGSTLGEPGYPGTDVYGNDSAFGSGGGGGRRGAAANSLYLKVAGSTSGAGVFYMTGRPGGDGGYGGSAYATNDPSVAVGAGGGGGGAGGAGGFLIVKYKVYPVDWSSDCSGGGGGLGGYGGAGIGPSEGYYATGGGDGSAGDGGSGGFTAY
jgi:hypothetical protein